MHAYLEPAGFFRCVRIVKDKIRQRTIEAYKLETILMKKIIALAVAAVVAAPAMADLTISANIETNTTTETGADFAQGGRVAVTVAGSTTMDSGMYAKAQTGQEFGLDGGRSGVDTYLEIGNSAANVKLGYVRESEIWAQPGDVYVAAPTGTVLYKGGAQRGRNSNNIIATVMAGPATLQAMVRPDANGDIDSRFTASAALGGVNLGAAIENDAAGAADSEGFVLHADAMLGGAALGASYAENDADTQTYTITAGVAGFNLGYIASEAGAVESDHYYAAYPMADFAGVDGLTATVAVSTGDINTGAEDVSGARLRFNYSF